MPYVSAKEMLQKAKNGRYAVGHFNLNNMESVRAFLLAAEEMRSPIILGVSGGTAKYMGGYRTIVAMVTSFIDYLNVSVPVALHVDHGTYEEVLDAIDSGFKSVMFDGSALPIRENLEKSEHILALCREKGISLECEVGAIGGEEDGICTIGECASPEDCRKIAGLGIDMLAAGIGNIHGKYPADWPGLRFDILEEIRKAAGDIPLVLHGGSQIPEEMVKKAVGMGICKVNVNTECQIAFTSAVREYIEEGKDMTGKGFTPRALLAPALEASRQICIQKMKLFGSVNQA